MPTTESDTRRPRRPRRPRRVGRALLALALAAGATGFSCDSDAAATFRQTATDDIGQGVKTIVDGVLDGLIAAIQDAGDGSSSSDTSSGS